MVHSNDPPHILVVDDEAAIRALLRDGLEAEGFAVSEAANQAVLIHSLEAESIDLITHDLTLGKEDGLAIARRIRSSHNVPIIMVTGKGATQDRIVGLECGADDYIAKPFHMRELVLRVRNTLGRYSRLRTEAEDLPDAAGTERYALEAGVLDVPRRELRSADGAVVKLTDTEFDLLKIFVRRPTRILSRDDLMRLLKGRDWSPLERTLDGHIARLRKKIEPKGEAPRLIKSVRSVGYVFAGDVERVH